MSYQLIDTVQCLGHPRLLVLGDLILDRYIWGDAERVSQEAPVILLREERQEVRLGGAANVAHMLRGLECEVSIAGVAGQYASGTEMVDLMSSTGIDCTAVLTDESRPTTVKERYLGRAQHRHPHQILRVDREQRHPISPSVADDLLRATLPQLQNCQAVLISDYAKGICTEPVVRAVIDAASALQIPVIADPASTGDCRLFSGATAITPNRLEAHRATGHVIDSIDAAFDAGRQLVEDHDLEFAFVTLDSDGIALSHRDGTSQHLPTRKRQVYDITGAGDMVLAIIGLGAAAGRRPADLARLANVAGGLEVEQIGVVAIPREEILTDLLRTGRSHDAKLCELTELKRQLGARRTAQQRIVLTNGCFDVLHLGHVTYLQQAAELGDCLVVALNSDDSVRRLNKGPERPVFGQQQRAAMLAALEAVDFVVVFDEDTPHRLIEHLQPDLLVKGGTYTSEQIEGKQLVESYGGAVRALGVVEGLSTTEILQRIRSEPPPTTLYNPQLEARRNAG
ncbi:MAG: D-glycero-beta-D-manno-heptose 1-phosphate adenylyltransferase [Planctomycetaceae bacterium]